MKFRASHLFPLAACALLSASADAEDCSPIDLTQSTFKDIPNLEQDGLGICYGEAAAGMVDAWRFTHGDTRRTHLTSGLEASIGQGAEISAAADRARTHHEFQRNMYTQATEDLNRMTWDDVARERENVAAGQPTALKTDVISGSNNPYSGKQLTEALTVAAAMDMRNSSVSAAMSALDNDACQVAEYLERNGSCNGTRIAESTGTLDFAYGTAQNASWLYQMTARYDSYHAWRAIHGTVTRVQGEATRAVYARKSCHLNESFGIVYEQTDQMMQATRAALKQDNPIYFLKQMIEPACPPSNKVKVPPFDCSKTRMIDGFNKPFADSLGINLAKGMPLEIDFCSGVLKAGPRYQGNMIVDSGIKQGCAEDPNTGESDAHAALVIGRRPNPATGKCEYLVRNSWGVSCDFYQWCEGADGKATPLSQLNGLSGVAQKKARCPGRIRRWDCNNGNIWVDGDALMKNTYTFREFSEPRKK